MKSDTTCMNDYDVCFTAIMQYEDKETPAQTHALTHTLSLHPSLKSSYGVLVSLKLE